MHSHYNLITCPARPLPFPLLFCSAVYNSTLPGQHCGYVLVSFHPAFLSSRPLSTHAHTHTHTQLLEAWHADTASSQHPLHPTPKQKHMDSVTPKKSEDCHLTCTEDPQHTSISVLAISLCAQGISFPLCVHVCVCL